MPSVLDVPEVVEDVDVYDLHEEQPQARAAHPGFWQTVKQYVTWHRVQTPTGTPSSSHVSRHPIEMPLERLVREHPTLFLRVFTGV
jgi:hypothetical protein